jgi:hypothetical protein
MACSRVCVQESELPDDPQRTDMVEQLKAVRAELFCLLDLGGVE